MKKFKLENDKFGAFCAPTEKLFLQLNSPFSNSQSLHHFF